MPEERIRNEIVTVGTTSTQISLPKFRRFIYLRNSSSGAAGAAVITVCFSNVEIAVANTGFILNPNEYVSDSDSGLSYAAWNGNITAISTVADASLTVVERI